MQEYQQTDIIQYSINF